MVLLLCCCTSAQVVAAVSRRFGWLIMLLTGLTLSSGWCQADDHFERFVRPVLLEHCIDCHGPQNQEGGIRLDRRQSVMEGTASDVPLVIPGDPDGSRIAQVIAWADDDIQMPPDGRLDDADRAALRKWILDGGEWPEAVDLEMAAERRAAAWRDHWAFQPVSAEAARPPVADSHPVDVFIRRRLDEEGLSVSPQADPRTLVRRLSFAITGLPPAESEFEAAEAAAADGRFDTWWTSWVDTLLARPQFGERWARYWMDVSRYADTKGYVFTADREYEDAWRYREWLIQALNSDLPYDEFLRRQLAADQLPGNDDPAQLAAMGFLTLGRRFLNNQHDIIDDRIDVVSRGMLGLTASCARCHDHKFDPIPTADYYALYGVFASSEEPGDAPSPLRLVDRETPVQPVVFVRGSPANRGDRVSRHFFTALTWPEVNEFTQGSGRLELADAIASRDNPLTARVAVNRIWMHLVGRGLVESPSDFGVRTPPPSHPKLLDYLAATMMEHDWSVKHVIRQIVTSATWRQSSRVDAATRERDPENQLLARMNRRRLDFEAHRDAILRVAGTLDETIGGRSVDITVPDAPPRRTVYARIDRQNLPGLFRTFDLASPDQHAPRRYQTTVPQQALFQMNHPFMMEQAAHVAKRAEERASSDQIPDQVRALFQQVLQREPTAAELAAASEFLRSTHAASASSVRGGWSYGYGTVEPETGRLTSFTPLPHFQEDSWRGGSQLPDPQLGWVMLNRGGGHAGGDLSHCAVRRWTAPAAGRVQITGEIAHTNAQGDGIRGRVIGPGGQVLLDEVVHNRSASPAVAACEVAAGQTIDFVVDCRENESHDSFRWAVHIRQQPERGPLRTWDSRADFSGDGPQPPLSPVAQLAQTLMMTNEFVFVD